MLLYSTCLVQFGNLYILEWDMEQLTGSKLGKNYEKVDNFYVVYIM